MSDAFTIRIFVPDGDPDGVRVVDRMNWTSAGIAFPRSKWPDVKPRKEQQAAEIRDLKKLVLEMQAGLVKLQAKDELVAQR